MSKPSSVAVQPRLSTLKKPVNCRPTVSEAGSSDIVLMMSIDSSRRRARE